MGIVIDTDVLIELERGRIKLADHVAGREQEEFFITVITASELLHGVWRAENPGIRARRTAFVEALLRKLSILPIDLSVARVHARLWAELQTKGIMIGVHDSWISAISISYGYSLVTMNVKDFKRVPGLLLETWKIDK